MLYNYMHRKGAIIMEIKNCKSCKRIFNYLAGEQVCPSCKDKLEQLFQKVKKHIIENPNQNINDVAEDTEVTVKQIKQWVRESRLSFSDSSLVGLECERCGAIIKTGRFCDKCAGGLADAMSGMYRVEAAAIKKEKASAKMRFLE